MYNVRLDHRWIFICALLFIACTEKHETLRKCLQRIDPEMLSNGIYMVIPNQGCEGCISQAEDFVKKHIASTPQVRYIFTRIQSTKLLRIKLGNEVISNSHVLLDTNNIIVYPDKKNNIYPMIVIIVNHKITDITYQSPTTQGFAGFGQSHVK